MTSLNRLTMDIESKLLAGETASHVPYVHHRREETAPERIEGCGPRTMDTLLFLCQDSNA